MLLDPLDPNSPLALIIKGWGPPLISILIGGLFASILFPRWQDSYTRARAATQHRLDLTEQIASAFARYITAWRRLIDIATLGQNRELNDEELERLSGFAADRNNARDELLDLCARGQLYFGKAAATDVASFLRWDEAQASKTLEELPKIEEWRAWESKVLKQLKRDIGMSRR